MLNEQWYYIPIDYDYSGNVIPKYSDGYDITYFNDKPFDKYVGTILGERYIVKVSATPGIHEKLAEKEDVVILKDAELADTLNLIFMQNHDFEFWDSIFNAGG